MKMRLTHIALAMFMIGQCSSNADSSFTGDTLKLRSGKELGYDKGTKPNESGPEVQKKLAAEDATPELIYSYYTHYSPVIRKTASKEMGRHGEKALPFLIKALQSGDKYKIRAACDTISQVRGFFGVTVRPGKRDRNAAYNLDPAASAKTMPYLVPLLRHKDMYVRAGALQAMSRCGKAAAPHLPKVAPFLNDDEWWLRAGAAYVLSGVGSPEADKYLPALAKAMTSEKHVQCLNIMSATLKGTIKTSADTEALVKQVANDLDGMWQTFHRSRGTAVLAAAGPDAKVALPILDKRIATLEKTIAAAKAADKKLANHEEWELNDLKKTRLKIAPKAK